MKNSPAAPSRRDPKRLRRWLEYWAARCLVTCLSVLPLRLSSWLGRRLGGVIRILDTRHRTRAEEQVRDRLGLDPEAVRQFVKRNFHNYGMAMAEFAALRRMRPEDFPRYVDLGAFREYLQSLRSEGKGVLFITAHFGSWEWCNSTASSLGVTGGSIARPLDNPRLNEYIRMIRERNGLKIFDKMGAIRKALGALRSNDIVGVLIDQDAGHTGMMSPFLGRPASTITIPVELAMRTGAPMVVVGLRRGGSEKRFTMLYSREPLRADPDADPAAEVRRLTDTLNARLGEMIMQAPEQWFWIHRRWKSQGNR